MFKNILPFALLIVIYSSCSHGPVKVVIDKKDLKTGKIKIDNKDEYTFKSAVISLTLSPGKHSYILNNEPSKDFTVGDKGGLLNLDNQEYVAYELEFADPKNETSFTINSLQKKSMILIDSFVIMPIPGGGRKEDDLLRKLSPRLNKASSYPDSLLRKILPKLQQAKNGNYYSDLANDEYDTNSSVQGLKKFGKDKLFIESFWDYAIGDKIPQSITVTSSNNSFVRASTTRIALMHASLFLLAARLSPEEYMVKHITAIQAGLDDKAKEAEQKTEAEAKEKKQMKF